MATRVDGRTARRDRNSDAVLDAVHELFVEGQIVPTVEDVAARSGVSPRSVYRYFPDSRALLGAALTRRIEVAEPLWQLEDVGQGSLDDRIERLVAHRLALYETSAPTIRAALSLAHEAPAIARQVERRRQQLSDQTRRHFAAELAAHPGAARRGRGHVPRAPVPVRGHRAAAGAPGSHAGGHPTHPR